MPSKCFSLWEENNREPETGWLMDHSRSDVALAELLSLVEVPVSGPGRASRGQLTAELPFASQGSSISEEAAREACESTREDMR